MKLSEIEHRIAALEHALSNLQQCPADPCHVHYAAEGRVTEPTYDVTEENWHTRRGRYGIFQSGIRNCVCLRPDPDLYPEGAKLWPQRKVLIAHAPGRYRQLEAVYRTLVISRNHPEIMRNLEKLLDTIKKELQENE